MNSKRRYIVLILTGIIAAICIELCLACFSARRGSVLDENQVLFPENTLGIAAIEGPYRISQELPWLDFAPRIRGGCLEFDFTEPLQEKLQVLIYYTEKDGQEFNRFRRIERWLMEGTTKGKIALPDFHYEKLRLALNGEAEIKSVSVGKLREGNLGILELLAFVNLLRLFSLSVFLSSSVCLFSKERRKKKEEIGDRAENIGTTRQRTAFLDGVRVLAALFVIAVHVVEPVSLVQAQGTSRAYFFHGIVQTALTCNLLFFFISGALLLPFREESIGEYYKKRVVKILIPFALYALFYLKLLCATQESSLGWGGGAVRDFFGASITMGPHLWLIYKLLSVYLLVPFLRLMLAGMPVRMEKQLFVLILAALTIRTAGLYFNFEVGLSFYLDSWLGLFLAGYLLNREWMRSYDRFLFAGGAASFALSLWIYGNKINYLEITANCSILSFLMASAIFVLIFRMNGLCLRFSRILQILGRRSFSVLMIHLFVMSAILPLGFIPEGLENRSMGQLAIPYIFTCVVSYVIAVAVDETAVRLLEAGAARLFQEERRRKQKTRGREQKKAGKGSGKT